MKLLISLIPLLLIGLAAAADVPTATTPTTTPTLEIKLRKPDDQALCTEQSGKAVIAISCPSGIGSGAIIRSTDHWPPVVLRMHLRGLSMLSISAGKLKLLVSMSAEANPTSTLQLWTDGKEGPPLGKESPYWSDIHTLDAAGNPVASLPKDGGCFEMAIPAALLENADKSLNLEWIDFYR